jgi:mannose-6-phosphate isomerase-like protein (cupin superfamily)
MQIIDGAGVFGAQHGGAAHWAEHLRVPDLSVGTYSIPAGGTDGQTPHTEDEIYVVVSGRAVIEASSGQAAVAAGSVIFVPAGETHRFTGITEDLALLVVFGPAEGSRAS